MNYKEWLEDTVAALVDSPEHIEVHEIRGGQTTVVELHVHKDDVGKVIGKEGRLAQAMRILLRAMAVKNKERIILEIIDN
jgi:predicted RNA-binding protein YlqC (UPF0109 family)